MWWCGESIASTIATTATSTIIFDDFVVDLVNIYNTGINVGDSSDIIVQYNEVKNTLPPADPGNDGAGLNAGVRCNNITSARTKVHDLATSQPVTNNMHGIYIKCNNVLAVQPLVLVW